MLGPTYRIQVLNESGQAINGAGSGDVTVKAKRHKWPSGVYTLEGSEAELLNISASLADGAVASGTTQDNTSNLYEGGTFECEVVHDNASANGPVTILLQRSTDGGTTWPDDGAGDVLTVFDFSTNETKRHVVTL